MLNKHRNITAEDIMSEVVITVKEDFLVRDAAHLMFRDRINGVPVVNEKQKIVGLLTVRDLFRVINTALGQRDSDLYNKLIRGTDFRVREIMTTDVLTVAASASLEEIIYLTLDMRIHTFPVMDGNKLIGIVGSHDILNAVFSFI